MNEWFAYLVEKNGPLTHAEPFTSVEAQRWQARLPSGLLELWQEQGVGMWADGKFQFCRPQDYTGITDLILQRDLQFDPRQTYLVGFGAFGDLLFWNEITQKLRISLPYLRGYADCTEPEWTPVDSNGGFVSPLMRVGNEDQFTLFENTPAAPPMFRKCLKKLGHLALGECYGLFPALALGGSTDLGSVRRVRALEHFAILAQLGPIRLVDYSDGQERFVRHLGAQV